MRYLSAVVNINIIEPRTSNRSNFHRLRMINKILDDTLLQRYANGLLSSLKI